MVDVLVKKSIQAVAMTGVNRLAASGGVLCNKTLRDDLEFASHEAGIELLVADPRLLHRQCGDDRRHTRPEKLEAGIEAHIGTTSIRTSIYSPPSQTGTLPAA